LLGENGPSGAGFLVEHRHLPHFIAVAEELHFARAVEGNGAITAKPLDPQVRNIGPDVIEETPVCAEDVLQPSID